MKAQMENAQLQPTNDVVKCLRCKKMMRVTVYLDLKAQNIKCDRCGHVQAYNSKGLEKKLKTTV